MNSRTTWGVLWRQRTVVGAVVLATALVVAIGLTLTPRCYTATATATTVAAEGTEPGPQAESERATLAELVDSRDVLEDVALRLSTERSVSELRDAVAGRWLTGTMLIQITAEDHNPEVAAEIANAVASVLAVQDPSNGTLTISIEDPAEPPDAPSGPNLPILAAAGALLSILVGVLAALLWDRLRRRVDHEADLEAALAAPVLATIVEPRDTTSLPALDPGTKGAAIFRQLRLALEVQASDDPQHTIVVTGVVPSETTVWLAANLAITLAQVERKVLLIDGRLGDQHQRMDALPDTPGLYDVLQGEPLLQAVSPGPVERLGVVPAGDSHGAPTDVIIDSRFGTVTAEAADRFDVVVVLAPALSEGHDAMVMAGGGAMLIAVTAGTVSPKALEAHARNLRTGRVRLLCSVLLRPRG